MDIAAELQVFLRVSNKKALDRVVSRIRQTFPLGLGDESAEQYWKDPALQDVWFPVAVPQGSVGDMVFRVLLGAWSLGGPWSVSSAGQPGTPAWEFEAIASLGSSRFSVPGLEWSRISLHARGTSTG
ncbi:hypothetical protein ACSNOJ_25825 [Streptomyces sp. URMC 128]|uniref:hypothetical protein n=1 Tax=Streptomyces sp. URMC 128 TaxID=3423404 RepID=UPI003F1BFB26